MPQTRLAVFASLLSGLTAVALTPMHARASTRSSSGAWSVQCCDKTNPQRDCGGFTLDLVQDGNRLCGEHPIATVGLRRLDKGSPGSVLGSADGNKATVVIEAARTGARYLTTAEHSDVRLKWRIVGMVNTGESSEPIIIPQQTVLARDAQRKTAAHLQDVKDAPWRWLDD